MWMNALPTILTTALNFAITRRDLIIASVQKDMLSITSTIPPAMVCSNWYTISQSSIITTNLKAEQFGRCSNYYLRVVLWLKYNDFYHY